MTTRIRINIPGSRPIPPVVLRTPVGENTEALDQGNVPQTPPAPAEPAGAAETGGGQRSSDWFAPRKPPTSGGSSTRAMPRAFGGASDAGPGGPTTALGGDVGSPLLPPGFSLPTDVPEQVSSSAGFGGGRHDDEDALSDPPGGVHRRPEFEELAAGDSLHSAIPGPRSGEDPIPASPPPGPPLPQQPTPTPAPASSRGSHSRPSKKGRSKLVLVGVGLLGVTGILYGTGLLLDHSDVPNRTTVLGVEIGGSSKQEAVTTLERALGDRMYAPLTISLAERKHTLKPNVVGLSIDIEASVRNASGRDYNPVTVIGSLMGGARVAEPEITVDEEKLRAALEELSGARGASRDGTVTFEKGKATAVLGQPYEAVNVVASVKTVEHVYTHRAATGVNHPVRLPISTREPRVSEAEVNRALKEFGEPAMSGWIWVRAGKVEVPFSENTLSGLLSMKPDDRGTLQPVIDLAKLAEAYGGAFDKVLIDAGTGKVKVTSKHVASAMMRALREPAPPAPKKRVALVEGARAG